MSKFFTYVSLLVLGLMASPHAEANSQRCEAELSNTKISFNIVDGKLVKQSLFFASPLNPSKNMADSLEMKIALSPDASSNEAKVDAEISINIENYKAAESEGLNFPSVGSCDCQELPEDFDGDTFELFTKGKLPFRFTCEDALLM